MVESSLRFSTETGKPNPVSLKEFLLFDRHEQRKFSHALTMKESKDFQMSVVREMSRMRLKDRREIAQAQVKKLSARDNRTLGDRMELAMAKARLAHLMMPEKQPIFLRKLRTMEVKLPKWIMESKSPYFINTPRSI